MQQQVELKPSEQIQPRIKKKIKKVRCAASLMQLIKYFIEIFDRKNLLKVNGASVTGAKHCECRLIKKN